MGDAADDLYDSEIISQVERKYPGFEKFVRKGQSAVKRLDWMNLWDRLRNDIKTGNTTWGRNQILELMDRLEREMIRKFERGE